MRFEGAPRSVESVRAGRSRADTLRVQARVLHAQAEILRAQANLLRSQTALLQGRPPHRGSWVLRLRSRAPTRRARSPRFHSHAWSCRIAIMPRGVSASVSRRRPSPLVFRLSLLQARANTCRFQATLILFRMVAGSAPAASRSKARPEAKLATPLFRASRLRP
ncbi:Hypothetical protein CAP_3025 [Chondromyces apiculatus DSM 436]|uniref:Uncharacterized protein n=1 Tax=Chondromyces apiculatus DSM 436 TaxID=1192034 RepID=A0A017TA80_9BACT|nr:Hypothetical protein CAP_3025 [Chondromyces apiculatus DSM 436]